MRPALASPVLAAAALLPGLMVARWCVVPAPRLAVLLLALGLALRHRTGGLAAAVAVGLIAGWSPVREAPPDPGAPVSLVGVLEGHWRRSEDGIWLATLAGRHFRQGRRVALWRESVRVQLPGPEPPPTGRRLRVRGYLARPPGLANQPPLPPGPWRLRIKSRRFLEAAAAGRPWRLAVAARRRIERGLDGAGGPGTRLARALVLGDSSRLPAGWRRGLRVAGLAHLVALSGLHVGLLVGLCLVLGRALPRTATVLVAMLAAGAYLLVAGPRPALVRASVMTAAMTLGLLLERRPHGPSHLAVAAAVLVLPAPALLDDVGFRLTCSATAGILVLAPRFERRWPALPVWLRRPLAVSAAAQLSSLPWSLAAFRLLAPLAPLWNLLAVPWTGLSLAGCLGWAGLATLVPAAAVALAPALDPLAAPFAAAARLPVGLISAVPVVTSWAGSAALAAALAAGLLRPGRLWPLPVVAVLALAARAPPPPEPELRLLDVGQGEAVLLRDGPLAVLVDGGGWRYGDLGGRVLVPTLAAAGVRRLQAVVLTHPDLDHCQGLVDLQGYLPVAEIWTAPGWRGSRCARELLSGPVTRLRVLWAGERATVGRWRFLALSPRPGERRGGNDRSLVLSARLGRHRVLLTGDIEAAGERRLLARWPAEQLRAGILKVAHHGSRSSTTAPLLAAVRPRIALVSCGLGNRYGHPAAPVLERLRGAGARSLRTDLSGTIVLRMRPDGRIRVAMPAAPRPG